MPNAKPEPLYRLIKSLSKSEKRHFKLYATRSETNKDAIFVRLFDFLDYKKLRTDASIMEHLELKSTSQLSNARRHLYSQLLKSLRILYANKHAQIATNESIDFAIILDYKKLHVDSYELLTRLDIALNENYSQNYLTVTNYKRRISTQLNEPIDKVESLQARQYLNVDWQIEDLYLDIQNDFINLGYSRNEREHILRKERFVPMISILKSQAMTVFQNFSWHKLCVLYYTSSCNHYLRYRHAFYQFKYLKHIPYIHNEENYIDLLIQCTSTLLEVAHQTNNFNKFDEWWSTFEEKLLKYNKSRDKHGGAKKDIPIKIDILRALHHDKENLSQTNQSNKLFDAHLSQSPSTTYLIAQYFTYIGNYNHAIDILNTLINNESINLDIHLYSRFLALQCHYRLNNFQLVENLSNPLRNAFKTNGYLTKTIELAFAMTRKGVKALNFGLKDEINEMLNKCKLYSETPYEKTSFLYFDFYYWFESIKRDTTLKKAKYQ